MNTFYERVQSSPDVSGNVKYYWGYQNRLGAESIVPQLLRRGAFKAGDAVAEIGCGEGGVLSAFVAAGASKSLGTDIAEWRLETGRALNPILGIDIPYTTHDIVNEEPLPEWRNGFNVVLLRDVIEHLDDAEKAMAHIKRIVKPDGYVFVTFPPYNSPYGGHQHLLDNFWGKFPYMHLLPEFLFAPMVANGNPVDVEEVHRLRKIRLSPQKFLRSARNAGYDVVAEDYYLFRPVFKMKFGLPTIPLTPLKFLPFVREFFSLEAAYLLRVRT